MYPWRKKQKRTQLSVAKDIDQLLTVLQADFSMRIIIDMRPVVLLKDEFYNGRQSAPISPSSIDREGPTEM